MKDNDNYYNEGEHSRKFPNDGREEIDIEPLSWDDI